MANCASFFAGVGGIDKGFENTGFFHTVYANEIDSFPARTFELNFPHVQVDVRSITEVQADQIPDVDVIMGGFPCQAFSIAGYRQGFNDERGRGLLFFDIMRIIHDKPEGHKPHVLFLENVKNLQSHNNGETFQVILQALQDEGYYPTYKVLNACEYGNVPQNRERIYIVAFDNEQDRDNFNFPEPIELTTTLDDIIDFENIDAGTVVMSDAKKGLFVKTVDGKVLSILEIQGENSKAMPIKNYLNAKTFEVGKVLK